MEGLASEKMMNVKTQVSVAGVLGMSFGDHSSLIRVSF